MSNISDIKKIHCNIVKSNEDVVNQIVKAAECFKKEEGSILSGTNGLQFLQLENSLFFGVSMQEQSSLDFAQVRSHIFQKLQLSPDTQIIQVIGDSALLSKEGGEFSCDYLEKTMSDHQKKLLLWGYTGSFKENLFDVNHMVNQWIDKDSSRAEACLANVVEHGTINAITKHYCTFSSTNRYFYLVYDNNANFGDDILSSDSITDKVICFEGGAQTFLQIINNLIRGVKVKGVYGIREYSQNYLFSAGEFLSELKKYVNDRQSVEDKDLIFFKNNYFNSRDLFNKTKSNAERKEKLFQEAWALFLGEKLWKKLDLLDFTKFF